MNKGILLFIVFTLAFLALRRGKKERGDCSICGRDVFDPKMIDGMAFCSKHAKEYQTGAWTEFKNGHATPEDPEFGVRLYEFKQILNSKNVSSFIRANYLQQEDEIITEMVLMVLEKDLEKAEALSRSWEKI